MKNLSYVSALLTSYVFSSCSYEEPVFITSFSKEASTTGVYICDVVTINGIITLSDPDNEFIRSAQNSACGYNPGTISSGTPIRATTAVVDPTDPSKYHLTTTCYRIITNMAGISYPSNYWRPCSPNTAKLHYQYRDLR